MAKRPRGSGSLYRRNGWYYGRIKVRGEYVRMSLNTRESREAEKRLNEIAIGYDLTDEERLAALMVRLKPKTERRSFEDAWTAYERAPENAAQTAIAREDDLTMWNGLLRWLHGWDKPRSRVNCSAAHPSAECLDDITEDIASEYFGWLKETRSAATVNKYVRVLKRVWTLNRVEKNPWERFARLNVDPVQRRALSVDEVDMLIERAEGELRTLFVIGAFTGMRMGDCQKLRWESVCGDRLLVRTGKTKRLAGIPMHRRLKEVLGEPKKSGFVLPGIAAWPKWKMSEVVQNHFRECGFAEAETRAGYKRKMGYVGFHSLRSTFITRLGAAGVPLAVVREMVGHVSEEMSQRYFRIDHDMANKAIAALG